MSKDDHTIKSTAPGISRHKFDNNSHFCYTGLTEAKELVMSKEFVIDFIDWHGRRDTLFCRAGDAVAAREYAYRTLGDLIDIISVEEFIDG